MKRILILSLILLSAAGSPAAQKRVVPIVEMKVGALLGGVENGKFLDAKTTAEKLADRQNYTLYMPGTKSESLLLGKPTALQEEVCEGFYGINDYAPDNRHEKGGVALGEGFGWKPQPRAVKQIALTNAAYLKIVNDFLRTKRISTAIKKLDQAFSVDLDGDGREEIVLTSTRVDRDFQPKPNRRTYDAYSVVLVRKIVGGKARTIVLEGEFSPKSDAFYDGYTHEISSFADLDGDGKMEILLHGEYYEGSHTSVVQLNGGKVVKVDVLSASCGL